MKILKFIKATFSAVSSYYSDYENAYDEGYSNGHEEELTEGFTSGRTEGQVLWQHMYEFLEDRKLVFSNEEITTFEILERLLQYEHDLKNARNKATV